MDTDQLIAHGRARFDHAAARRLLRERYQAKMIFAHAGGMWQAGPALLTVLATCQNVEAVIPDLYDIPIKITVEEFKAEVLQRWQEQMNAWLIEHESLSSKR